MGMFTLERTQVLPTSLEELWDFVSSPKNLKDITPDYMGFDILSDNLEEKMYPGMMIKYHVSPMLGIKMKWVTEITHVKDLEFFVDEQRFGPYKIWHHQHHLKQTDEGIWMKDIVNYQPPMGILGNVANSIMIKNKLAEIFDYRYKKLEEIYGKVEK